MRKIILLFLWISSVPFYSTAQNVFSKFDKIVFGCKTQDTASFRKFVAESKERGATHIAINAEDLPIAYWELQPADDPYPAWVITNPGLLKINPPEKLNPYLPEEYRKSVMNVIRNRCKILEEYDMKASFHTFEPQMLPERFFMEYPALRGPQVDNPMRSRVERFAPSMTHPEVLEMYAESMKMLKEQCPSLDILEFRTNDSGAGIGWSNALYAGANGNSKYRNTGMADRIHQFLRNLQKGSNADKSFISDVHVYNTKEEEKEYIATQLDSGQALDNLEGPEAVPFKYEVGSLLYYRKAFAPVPGIPWPVTFLTQLEGAVDARSKRLFILMGDDQNRDLYFEIIDKFKEQPPATVEERMDLLRQVASTEVGENASNLLVNAWLALNEAEELSSLISVGGSIFIIGCVHQRWLTRPFVPFPENLKDEEKAYYRKFQFQARSEKHANDLLDLQASKFVDGFNGYRIASRILSRINSNVSEARKYIMEMKPHINNETAAKYRLLETRLRVFQILINNVDNAIRYQVVLNRALSLKNEEENAPYPFIGPGDYWSQQELMRIARREMDNTTELIQLLENHKNSLLIDHAVTENEEYQRLLGPELTEDLRKKISLMRTYWDDYKKIKIN